MFKNMIILKRCSAFTENFKRPSKTWKLLNSPIYVMKKV